MSKLLLMILGIFLTAHGLFALITALKGGPLRGVMIPGDIIVKKIFGQKASDSVFNFFFGLIEFIFGILILIGKFD